ncbi:MAG: hypothetical protein ABJN62_07110 [Halioglobus sp.]
MKLPTYQWIGQMLAATGVIMSLALVAWELKQSRDLGMADLYQQTAAMTMEYQSSTDQNEPLLAARLQYWEDQSKVTEKQLLRILHFADGWMLSKESIFYQNRIGVTPHNEWASHEYTLGSIGEFPCYIRRWNKHKSREFHADFVEEVNRIWANIPDECPFDDWD